uniref:Uncharacterized protein n=1 Tax=Ananas comosus var. bracteatus TaxID=296719 RepID=A0A6V7QVL1_ANACO
MDFFPLRLATPSARCNHTTAAFFVQLGISLRIMMLFGTVGDGGDGAVEGAAEAAPVVHSKRRLRLFGVNLECAPDLEEAPQTARSVFGLVNQTARTPTPLAPYYWCCIAVQGENRIPITHMLQNNGSSENITSTDKIEVSPNTAANAKADITKIDLWIQKAGLEQRSAQEDTGGNISIPSRLTK